jgi:hypothetical protein
MAWPVLIWIVVGVASLLVGTAVAISWDKVVKALKGKQIAVLGARGVGKTHLIQFLTLGSIPEEYKQTVAPEKTPSRRFQLRDLDLKVSESLDVSGDKAAYNLWKELHQKADVVFYLLRADRLIAGDAIVEARVREDLKHIHSWRKEATSPPRLFIIGTHCDLDPKFAGQSAPDFGNYVDKFQNLDTVMELVAQGGGTQQVKIVLGSMKSVETTEALVYQTFMQVVS